MFCGFAHRLRFCLGPRLGTASKFEPDLVTIDAHMPRIALALNSVLWLRDSLWMTWLLEITLVTLCGSWWLFGWTRTAARTAANGQRVLGTGLSRSGSIRGWATNAAVNTAINAAVNTTRRPDGDADRLAAGFWLVAIT